MGNIKIQGKIIPKVFIAIIILLPMTVAAWRAIITDAGDTNTHKALTEAAISLLPG